MKNPAGGTSTVFSFSTNIDDKEYLLPRVTPDGRFLSEDDAVEEFKKTGLHLGAFSDPESATTYAKKLHEDYEAGKYKDHLTFAESVGRGVDLSQSLTFGAMEAVGEFFGSKRLTEIGRTGRTRNIAEAEAAGPRSTLADIDGPRSFVQWAKETIGEQIPITAPMLAGGATGAAVGSVVPGVGTTIGGLIGAFAPGVVMGVGEVQSSIKERGEEQSAPVAAFVGGTAIAALDSVLPGRIGSRLLSVFGRETAEAVAKKALLAPVKQSAIRRVGKEAAVGMATEGLTEAIQEAIDDVSAATGTGTPLSPDLPKRMGEAGAAGALMGFLTAGAGEAVSVARRPEQATPQSVETTPAAAEPTVQTFGEFAATLRPEAPAAVPPSTVDASPVTLPASAPVVPSTVAGELSQEERNALARSQVASEPPAKVQPAWIEAGRQMESRVAAGESPTGEERRVELPFKAGDTVAIKGGDGKVHTVESIGDDGWVYLASGGGVTPDQIERRQPTVVEGMHAPVSWADKPSFPSTGTNATEAEGAVNVESLAARFKPDNPFAQKAARARLRATHLNQPTARDTAMANAFPLGAGFGRPSDSKRLDATVNRAVEAVRASREADYLEAQATAFDAGRINAQGRRISKESQARSEKREALQERQTARIEAAKAERGERLKWEVPGSVWADSTGNLGGGARRLLLGEHREAVETALAEGKFVPDEVLAEYPDLKRADVDAQAEQAETTEDGPEPEEGEGTGAAGRASYDRIAASVPTRLESHKQRDTRRRSHYRDIFRAVLTRAQAVDPSVDRRQIRKEFDARIAIIEDLDREFRESGHNPRELLEAIAKSGGISMDAERMGGLTGELRWVRESEATGPWGNYGGVKGVFRQRTGAGPVSQRTGLSLDEMATNLRQDARFAHIEGPDELLEALEDVSRMGDVGNRGAVYPGTKELAERAGMRPNEKWWADSWMQARQEEGAEPQPLTAESYRQAFGGTQEQAEAIIAVFDAMGLPKDRVFVVKGGAPGELTQAGQRVIESDAFKRWFRESKVVDAHGNPLVVYHGTQRLDRFGPVIKKKRATSGPMPFFTATRAIASKYADGKPDTSVANEDVHNYESWFRLKVKGSRNAVNLDRAWWFLTAEERARVAALAPRVSHSDDGQQVIELREEGHDSGTGGYDQHIKEARGNHLKALIEEWLNSGNLFNDERAFETVLKMAGVPIDRIEYHDPHADRSGVVPVYLSIQQPLVTSRLTDTDVDRLERRSRRIRKPAQERGADFWDKNNRDAKTWVAQLKEDRAKGENSFVWSSIPDWVTDELKAMWYDGIHDVGGKMGGDEHAVWIPFEPTQVKSAIGNRGTFDPTKPSILYQRQPFERGQTPIVSVTTFQQNGANWYEVRWKRGTMLQTARTDSKEKAVAIREAVRAGASGREVDAILSGRNFRIVYQGPRASVEFTGQGEAIIRALNNPNVSSGVHEAAHVARRFLFNRSLPQEVREGVTDEDIITAEEWAGAKDGVWNRDAEEKFARGFERYLANGEAPTSSLQSLFDKFARWLAKVYTRLTGSPIDIEISPAMKQVFDRLVTRSERLDAEMSFDVAEFESEIDKLYQSAWHGSPHVFDKFLMQKIGTGEGAQAYGWGLYFASRREVAKEYRDRLAGRGKRVPDLTLDGVPIDELDLEPAERRALRAIDNEVGASMLDNPAEGLAKIKSELTADVSRWQARVDDDLLMTSDDTAVFDNMRGALAALDKYGDRLSLAKPQQPGRLYKVEIPEDDKLLDWDERLSKQSPFVQKALADAGFTPKRWGKWEAYQIVKDGEYPGTSTGQWIAVERNAETNAIEAWNGRAFGSEAGAAENAATRNSNVELEGTRQLRNKGEHVYQDIAGHGGTRQEASEALAKLGIVGIRYRDQGSRPRNLVSERLHNLVTKHAGNVEAAVDEMGRSVHLTPKEKAAWRKAMIDGYEPITYNYVIFDDKLIEITDVLYQDDRKRKADLFDTGEEQPRLPVAGEVREQDVKTPEFEAPFSLTGEVSKAKKGKQETLFQSAGDDKRKRITLEALAGVAKRRGMTIEALQRVAEQAGYVVVDEGPRPVRAESGRELPPQKPIPAERLHEFPSIQKMPSVIRADIEEMLQRYQGFEAQRRGVQSWDRTQEIAKDLWLPLETLKPGKALNAEELSAYQTAIATALTMRKPLLEKIADGSATDWDRLQASHLTDVATILTASYRGAKAEAGRALNILRAKARVLDLRESAFLERAMKAPGFDQDLTKLSKEALDAAGDPLKQLEILRRRSATWFDYLQAVYYANLLSGLKTHLRNTIGNSFNVLANTVTPIGAAPVDVLRKVRFGKDRTVYLGEIPQSMIGAFIGVQQGMKNALFTMRYGFRPKAVKEAGEGIFDTPRVELPGGLKNPFNIPGRSLEAADEFFRAIAWHQELYAGAYTQARQEGAKNVSARMAEILTATDPTTEDGQAYGKLSYAADKFAARAVFQEEPGPITNWLLKAKAPGSPLPLRIASLVIAPFIKTPAAIMRQGFEWSPAGFAMRGARQAEGREQAQALGRAVLGSAFLLGPVAWLAATGRLTGAPPDDPGEREEFYAQGKLANAVRIGDYWVRYVLFQPYSVGMAAIANAWDKFKDSDQDQAAAEDAFITAIAGAGASLLDQSFLSGLGTFIDAVNDPKRYAGQWLNLFAQGFVPLSGMMRNVTQAVDPAYRRPEGTVESVQSIIPGVSDKLLPRRGRFGEAVTRPGGAVQRGFLVPEVSKAITDDVTQTLAAVGYRPITPQPDLTLRVEPLALTREQEDVLVEALGRERKFMIEAAIRRPDFTERADEVKREILERASAVAGRAVRARALRAVSRKEPLRLDRLVSSAVVQGLEADRRALLGEQEGAARVAR